MFFLIKPKTMAVKVKLQIVSLNSDVSSSVGTVCMIFSVSTFHMHILSIFFRGEKKKRELQKQLFPEKQEDTKTVHPFSNISTVLVHGYYT